MFGYLFQRLSIRPATAQSYRFLRARYERGFLKDLYHRRQLLGADPLLGRSSQPNWDYSSEVFAFANRIGAQNVSKEELVKALTTSTYHTRADIEEGADKAAPSDRNTYNLTDNTEIITKGREILMSLLKPFLRYNMPNAPEELIEAIANEITSDEILANIAAHIGLDSLVRTAEHPPSSETLANCFRSLIAVMDSQHAFAFVIDILVPQLIDVDFVDVFPLKNPLAVLTNLVTNEGAHEVEPRLLRSIGGSSAQPVFVVGIYKDKSEIIGQSAGESIEVSVDMAARDGLIRHWKLTADRLFLFGENAYKIPLDQFNKENYRLSNVCDKSTDLSLQEQPKESMNLVEVALKYKNEVESVVGTSYTKRLRHKFSRGSLHKRSHRYLVKPKVYTIA